MVFISDVFVHLSAMYGQSMTFRFQAKSMKTEWKSVRAILSEQEAAIHITNLLQERAYLVIQHVLSLENPSFKPVSRFDSTSNHWFDVDAYENTFSVCMVSPTDPCVRTNHMVTLCVDPTDPWTNQIDRVLRRSSLDLSLTETLPTFGTSPSITV